MKNATTTHTSKRSLGDWLRSIGPAVVVAAVVLGPGTITIASRVGVRHGYSVGWLVLLTSTLMALMTVAALYAGVSHPRTPGRRLRQRFGYWPTVAIGVVLFLIVALFQSGNNRALLLAAEYFAPTLKTSPWTSVGFLVAFNLGIVVFFLAARDVYRIIEAAMLSMVGLMIACFLVNAFAGGVRPGAAVAGLVPTGSSVRAVSEQLTGDIRALMATTFSVAGAFYQCYLVRERRWTVGELRFRSVDSCVGIATLGVLTMLIMWTAAAALHGKIGPEMVTGIDTLADSLRPTFGRVATGVFATGILAGAVSSFVGNALIGGTVFSDCLGLGSRASHVGPRRLTVLALIFGAAIACWSVFAIKSNVNFIVVAQGLTALGLPVMALALLWLLVDGGRAPKWLVAGTIIGVLVTFALAGATVKKLATPAPAPEAPVSAPADPAEGTPAVVDEE